MKIVIMTINADEYHIIQIIAGDIQGISSMYSTSTCTCALGQHMQLITVVNYDW
jgi:hypothetical protein